jgi:hypothetical protein
METEFNFKSQICTTRSQSEALLKLGLKKETADMMYEGKFLGEIARIMPHETEMNHFKLWDSIIPAWSLHRLLSLIPKDIEFQVSPMYGRNYTLPIELQITCELDICYIELNREEFKGFYGTDIYDSAIRCIEWLIKGGYFNKEYLV